RKVPKEIRNPRVQVAKVDSAPVGDERGQWSSVEQARDDLRRTVLDRPHDRAMKFMPNPVRAICVSGPHQDEGIECRQPFIQLSRNRVTGLKFPLIEPDVDTSE